MQSLGENKTDGYRAENRFFPQMKTSRKVHNCLHWFYSLVIMYCYAK